MIKQCEGCNIEFECYPSANRKYCTKSCYALNQKIWERTPSYLYGEKNKGFTGRTHSEETKEKISKSCEGKGRPRDERLIVNCKVCGVTFDKMQRFEDMNKHFCSQDCWHRWNKGENHICYNEELQREYIGFTDELKQTIRLRDEVCQICGMDSIEKSLSVHHIDCDKHNPQPTNLICLCESCHTRVHMNIKEWTGYLTKIIEDLYND